MIQFGQPLALWGFAAGIVLLSLWAWWNDRRSRRLLQKFAATGLLDRLTSSFSRSRQRTKTVLSLIACLCFLLALARPQWGSVTEEIELQGVDILFALDTSRSMLAEDYEPNRLERAKLAILDLVSRLEGDRVGLIAFAGEAFLQSPLTLDYSAFLQTLDAMDTDTIPRGGTDVAGAIDEAMAYFKETDHHRVLILISDGEDLEASGLQRAREAAGEDVSLFTVGVGSAEGELIPLRGPNGQLDYVRDQAGNPVVSRLDEQGLRAIAEAGGGIYRNLGNGAGAMDDIYSTARATVDEANLGSLTREIPIERYQWPLGLGLLCLALEWAIGTRRSPGNRKGGLPRPMGSGGTSALLLATILLFSDTASASPRQAERAYEDGDYARAIALWSEAAEAEPEDARLHYNLGNAHYRAGEFAAAIDAYRRALPLADVSLQERIFFNLGNAQFKLGEANLVKEPARTTELWEAAMESYANSLAIDPEAKDATRNRAWVERQFATHGARITVAATPPEGGTASGGGLFLPGTVLSLQAEANPDWRFVSWQGAEVKEPESPQTELVVQQSATIQAVFAETRTLEVKTEDQERGTAEKSGRYDLDADVPIEAKAADHFAFKEWVSETLEVADPKSAKTTVKLTQDGTVTATFADAYYLEVVSDPPIAGAVGSSGFFAKHSEVPIQAKPRDGFSWLGWSGKHVPDIGDFNAQQTHIIMNGDRKAIAQFERIWNLVVLPNQDEAGTTTGGGNFPIGTIQPIEAKPKEGYAFERWEGPGVRDPEAASTTVEVLDETHDVIAVFKQENGDDENSDDSDSSDSQSDDQPTQSEDEPKQDESEKNPDQPEGKEGDDESSSESESAEEQSEEESETEEDAGNPQSEESGEPEKNAGEEPQEQSLDRTGQAGEPGRLTEEEAKQMLQILRQDERQLPLRLRSGRNEQQQRTGRDW